VAVLVVAILVCGRFGFSVWPFWSDLWPFWLWPFWFVSVLDVIQLNGEVASVFVASFEDATTMLRVRCEETVSRGIKL